VLIEKQQSAAAAAQQAAAQRAAEAEAAASAAQQAQARVHELEQLRSARTRRMEAGHLAGRPRCRRADWQSGW